MQRIFHTFWMEFVEMKLWQKHKAPSLYRNSKLFVHRTKNGKGKVARLMEKYGRYDS